MTLPEKPDRTDEMLRAVGAVAVETGVPVYAVGGAVRDRLLGHPVLEIDFVVAGNADAPAFAETARRRLRGTGYTVFERFGTCSFLVEPYKLEFAGARRESYRPDSRKPEVQPADLSEDLARRDFTVNAMAMGIRKSDFGDLIDPFDGRSDLAGRILRTPLDPLATFSDDPLRILRAARFAGQLGFRIHPDTLAAMRADRERVRIVSQERLSDEILKMLSQPVPSVGLRILQETGVLEIVFPELSALTGVEQRDDFHHKDVFEHTLKVVDNIARMTDKPLLRFLALVHDIGKPQVKRFVEGVGWTFHNHENVGERMLKRVCGRLKLPNEYLKYSRKLTALHMRPIQLIGGDVTDSAVRRLLFQAGEDIEDLMMLCRADITSGNPRRAEKHLKNFDAVTERMREVEEKDKMRAFQSPVRGEEIMELCGIRPGPAVGRLKTAIEEAILDGLIPNEHDAARDYLLKIKDQALADPPVKTENQ
ncbi:HD domain-containing protein [bacterium]|nr:HD domain-containing protein [bacterium]